MQDTLKPDQLSDFMKFLAVGLQSSDRVPSLSNLSKQLGVSVASLREQLEVARVFGLVEVRPKTGIRRLPFTFRPAVQQGLAYAVAVDYQYFKLYSDFRRHVETAYWYEAVEKLEPGDHQQLQALVAAAQDKLRRSPVQIPHGEHRELHLIIYRRLENPFVVGVMEAYWSMYEAVGLDVYTDLQYLQKVWAYHQKMVNAICVGDFKAGFDALTEHMDLLNQREKTTTRQVFE